MVNDQEITKKIQEQESRQKDLGSKVGKSLSNKQLLIAVLIFLVLSYLTFIENKFERNTYFILLGVMAFVIYLFIKKTDVAENYVDIETARSYALAYMRKMQRQGMLPEGKIALEIEHRTKRADGRPKDHYIRAKLVTSNNIERNYYVMVDCQFGRIYGIVREDKGFVGKEIKDVIPIESLEQNMMRRIYGNNPPTSR